ncbi:glycosyltransferase [Agromyces aureus]|uniref:Glycosyl transferase family 1 domain-containing protein n=1 Tax=Agromyces aureus TaxID=453304 RepID=A0A191WHP0_9MICO|nr:glycosyltransferase [Agromyces aureus]ANJ27693.1 hypothetical protein ATC03_14220 [Agromyces aureus]
MAEESDLTVVFHVGDERRLALPSLRSLERAIAFAAARDIQVEVIAVGANGQFADRSGRAFTLVHLEGLLGEPASAAVVRGIEAASGRVIVLLDSDVLVSATWIASAFEEVAAAASDIVVDSELLMTFGATREVAARPRGGDRHAVEALAVTDPWGWRMAGTAVALRRVVESTPASSLRDAGWLWNGRIAADRIERRIAPGTALMLREPRDLVDRDSAGRPMMLRSEWLARRSSSQPAAHAATSSHRGGIQDRIRRLPRPAAAVARLAIDTVRPTRDAFRRAMAARRGSAVPEWLVSEMRELNRLEPAVPFPRPSALREYRSVELDAIENQRAEAYWRVRSMLPDAVDYLFFAPWVRTGGGDFVLAQYIAAVRRIEPTASIALVTTEFQESTRLDLLPPDVHVVELRTVGSAVVDRAWCTERLLPQLIAQLRPITIHAFNSTMAFDVIEARGDELAADSAIFLSTFVVDRTQDGERTSVMFYRRDRFLDPVTAVLVDSASFVSTMVDDLGYECAKFRVQRNIVAATGPTPVAAVGRDPMRPLRLVWAGRFDVQKRLDLLAAVAREIARRELPVEIDFYGEQVMGDSGLAEHLLQLEEAGAHRYPAFTGGFSSLPLTEYGALLMTSEWEGVPITMLEAMGAGLPVIAPTVGGVGEVLTESVGYPIDRFDDVQAYVAAIESMLADPEESSRRAAAARDVIRSEFSAPAFDERLASIPGYLRGSPAH